MEYCILDTPYKGSDFKKWLRETAKEYLESGPDVPVNENRANFKFNGMDIISWMTMYYNSIIPRKYYKMTMKSVNVIVTRPRPEVVE